jgi:hypothetical protein
MDLMEPVKLDRNRSPACSRCAFCAFLRLCLSSYFESSLCWAHRRQSRVGGSNHHALPHSHARSLATWQWYGSSEEKFNRSPNAIGGKSGESAKTRMAIEAATEAAQQALTQLVEQVRVIVREIR